MAIPTLWWIAKLLSAGSGISTKSKTVKELCKIAAERELEKNPAVDLGECDPAVEIAAYMKEKGYVGLTDGEVCKCEIPDIFVCSICSTSCNTYGKEGVGKNYILKKKILSDLRENGVSHILKEDFEQYELGCLISCWCEKVKESSSGYVLIAKKGE